MMMFIDETSDVWFRCKEKETEQSTSEGQHMQDVLEIKSDKSDRDGLNMYRGVIANILEEGG